MFRTFTWISIVLASSFLSFYFGVWVGIQATGGKNVVADLITVPCTAEVQRKAEETAAKPMMDSQLDEHCKERGYVSMEDAKQKLAEYVSSMEKEQTTSTKNNNGGLPPFSQSLSHFVKGLVRVNKGDLMQTYDLGVPIDADTEKLDALILYTKYNALPSDTNVHKAAQHEDPTQPLPFLSATAATENCDVMNVVLLGNNHRECFALVGSQYQSNHIQRWMRRADVPMHPACCGARINSSLPLILSSRGLALHGMSEFIPPLESDIKKHQARLLTYLTEIDGIKKRLRQTLVNVKGKTVIVMTCNRGQSELLMNFACSARARGLDLQSVVVFPTDMETKELAEGIGLTAFYEETIMATIPKEESQLYGDYNFADVMFAKVLCVQLVNELGYDLLFQDVDVVWFKSPLDFFHDKSLPKFDMYFQDDGNRQLRFAPYSANTGFYYVRSNEKTQHFFRQFLYSADLIAAWYSHQAVLIALLGEHSSMMGLSVKVYSKEMEEFPGGLQFHRKKEVMKSIIAGTSNAYIFHMSWTENKSFKFKYLQQLGEWYVNDNCLDKEAHEIYSGFKGGSDGVEDIIKHGSLISSCCAAEPIFKCHYRDKPSKIPCPDSPYTEKRPREAEDSSFW
jgi:hypothetical protein